MNQTQNFGEEKKEEKLEFLKREEIRTMAKDIARLREIESQEERERITALKPKEEIKPPAPPVPPVPPVRVVPPTPPSQPIPPVSSTPPAIPSRPSTPSIPSIPPVPSVPPAPMVPQIPSVPLTLTIPGKKAPEEKKETPVGLIPKISKKPSLFQKILVRTIFLLILFLILGFFYWFFAVKQPPIEEKIVPIEEEISEITIPPSLIIPVNTTETLEIAAIKEELPLLLKKEFDTDAFIRILIKDTPGNKIFGLKEFFEEFQIKTPEGLLEKLNNDFTLFVYSGANANRLGFVAQIETGDGLVDLMKSWEPTMEKDTENLFTVLGKEGTTSPSYFREATYRDVSFRYISFPQAGFGLCWAVTENKLLFTSSGNSIMKIIDELKK